jgi:hypothetical protein
VIYQGILSGTSVPDNFLDIVHEVEIYFDDRIDPKKSERRSGRGG